MWHNPTGTGQTATVVSGKTSAQLGIMAHKEFSEHFALQPALMYCGKGAKDASLNYLELPVNLVYMKGEGHGFFVSIGPYIGYAIGGKGVSIGKKADSTSLDWSVKSVDFGAQAAFGWQLSNGLIFKLNYDIGIPDLNLESNGEKITTGTFMFSIGWLLWGESMYDF